MVFLVGLSRLTKHIRKNKVYRWVLYIICAVAFFAMYGYVHRIITHTVIHFPMWMWCIIPVITIIALLLTNRIKRITVFLSIVLGGCFGILITSTLSVLFYTTNYWFASSQTYHIDAYVIGRRYIERHGGYRHWGLSTYNVSLEFINSKDTFRLDDPKTYNKCNQGDAVKVYMVKGFYGVPVIKDLILK